MLASLLLAFCMDYAAPAGVWNEALPLGNGRIGAMVFGNPASERIQLNEDTLWAGSPNDSSEPRIAGVLAEVRRRVLSGDPDGAWRYYDGLGFGASKGESFSYQTLGSLRLVFPGHDFPQDYRRSLSLDEAIARTEYEVAGVRYVREALTAFGDDVLLVTIRASKPGAISFQAFFESPFLRMAAATSGLFIE